MEEGWGEDGWVRCGARGVLCLSTMSHLSTTPIAVAVVVRTTTTACPSEPMAVVFGVDYNDNCHGGGRS